MATPDLGCATDPRRQDREMEISRAQRSRVLDLEASNVTLDTLSRAARVLGHSLKVERV